MTDVHTHFCHHHWSHETAEDDAKQDSGDARTQASFRDWIAVLGAVLGAFMAVLDIQVTNASLEYIQGGLAASLDEGSWISTAYLMAEIIIIPLTSWFAEVFSLRRYLLFSCIGFLIFSVLCGLCTNLLSMILCRIGQGFTAGALIPLALSTVTTKLPASKRQIGLSLFGFTATFAPAIGPTIGGWLTITYSWHYIFYVNVIPGLILIWAVWYGHAREPMHLDKLRDGDWFGIVTMAIGLGSLIAFLEEGERKDWFTTEWNRYAALAAAIFIPLAIINELTVRKPFIELRLLWTKGLGATSLIGLALGLGLYGSVYILPLYLAQIQRYNALQIGEVVMWLGVPQLFLLPLLPIFMRRIDGRYLVAFGMALFAVSCIINGYMSHDTAMPQLRLPQLIRALGQPFIIVPLSALATGPVSRAEQGQASALFNVMRNLGGSVGIAMLSTFTTFREHYHFSIISEGLTQNNLRLAALLHSLPFAKTGAGPSIASLDGIEMLRNLVRREAFVMAYSDCFLAMGVALALSLLLLFFVRVPAPRKPGKSDRREPDAA